LWLLFPTWLLGAAVRRAHERVNLARNLAAALCIGGIGALILVKASGTERILNDWFNGVLGGFPAAKLRYSQNAPGDLLVAACIGLVIFAARDADYVWLKPLDGAVRRMASTSFSLYLAHFPLLQAHGVLFPRQCVVIRALAAGNAIVLGVIFEPRKRLLRQFLLRMIDRARLLISRCALPARMGRPANRL
jgi:peptidoglycan/LPS O-acetylase OafA/YrhL